jgi:hypothetical protein
LKFIDEVKRRPDWSAVPILVVASECLSPEDREQLNNRAAGLLEEQRWSVEDLLGQVREIGHPPAR